MAEQCCERYDCSCDHHPEKKENGVFDLVDPVNTICVFVEGGVVQNVTGIPFGTKLTVVDYDTDGIDAQNLDLVKISEDEEPEQVNIGIYSHEARDGMGLTAEQRLKYLNHPYACPFCGKDSISGEEINIEMSMASQQVGCPDCGSRWTDIYKLVDLEKQS